MTFLVSPTEPPPIRAIGEVSLIPERHGVDVAFALGGDPGRLAGIQRKTLDDLVVSLRNGRLGYELARTTSLAVKVLVVEGRVRWSPSGRLTTARPAIDRAALRGLLFSVQLAGAWVLHTDDVADTIAAITHLRTFLAKPAHSLTTRPPVADDWGVRLLRCLPSIGPVTARSIVDHFDGPPLQWDCTEDELARVPGIGAKRAAGLLDAFSREGREPRRARAAS